MILELKKALSVSSNRKLQKGRPNRSDADVEHCSVENETTLNVNGYVPRTQSWTTIVNLVLGSAKGHTINQRWIFDIGNSTNSVDMDKIICIYKF